MSDTATPLPPRHRPGFRNRILLSVLLPVLCVGVICALAAGYLLAPALTSPLKARIDSELKLATAMGLQACETNFSYLLDLRLEDDPVMNASLKKEAAKEVVRVSRHFHRLQMVVVENGQVVVDASGFMAPGDTLPAPLPRNSDGVSTRRIADRPVRCCATYFPFWRWHIVSFIPTADYLAPIQSARITVYLSTFGVLVGVWIILLIVLNRYISAPLKRLTTAARDVAAGSFQRLSIQRRDEIGQVVQAFNLMIDSLNTKNREVGDLIRELKQSESRYRALFEGAVEGILIVDAETRRIQYANTAICRMLAYEKPELENLEIARIHPAAHRDAIMTALSRMADGRTALMPDIPCRRKDGATLHADIKGAALDLDQRRSLLLFVTDITPRKAAEKEKQKLSAQLQRSEKMEALGTLAGGVAHDLNNILSGLVSYPELLLMDMAADHPLRKPIRTIEKSGKKAAAIVQDLLTLARRGVAVTEIIDLNTVVTEYLASPEHAKLVHFHPDLRITADLDPDPLPLSGSPAHLAKTVMNLVSNAAEATPGSGEIRIQTRNRYVDLPIRGYDAVKEGDYAVLTVSDDGMGIPEEEIPRIFEPFYTKKVMGRSGTGLGMAVVWGTVKDHQGYIDVKSVVGEGARFDLYFPVARGADPLTPRRIPLSALMGDGEKILVVDDVPEQREIAVNILLRLNYDVRAVGSGEEAVLHAAHHRIDLLILDMIMDPGMDGLETYRQVLVHRPGQKAIITSGFSETERVRRAQGFGAALYVSKPYTIEKIGAAVRDALTPNAS